MRPLFADHGDAGWIVVDEAAGVFVAVLGVTFTPAALVAFVVFRLADIFKNWFPGVSAAERLPGPTGIMSDDLVAGIYGLVAGQVVLALL
jgi:phosphatidylglycerophosphatase A